MESAHYQIHPDRVIPGKKVKLDYLLCQICNNLIWQPEKCSTCKSHFCRFCISFSLLKDRKCSACLNEYIKSPPDHYLIEDLSDLNVKCVYSFNGCNRIVNYEKITHHEKDCIYKEIICEECNTKILKKYYHTHIIICKNAFSGKNFFLDCTQIINYYQDKFNKIEKDNLEDITMIRKNFKDIAQQKEDSINKMLMTIQKQHKQLEEIANEYNINRTFIGNNNNINIAESLNKSEDKINCNFI
jgi:hypothetical protein